MKITIRDVAEHAGVSVMTASRALNGERHVSEASRERVRRAVAALGFRRNAAARGLSRSRSFLICLIMYNRISPYYAEFQRGAIEYCRGKGYHLVLLPCDADRTRRGSAIADAVTELRPDGLIVLPPAVDDRSVIDAVRDYGRPCVRVAPGSPVAGMSSISIDEVGAAQQMTDALLDLGHERIGFLGGPVRHAASAWRQEGFRRAFAERGVSHDPALIRPGTGLFESTQAEAASLIATAAPTAIFAFNDETALAAMGAAYRAGLRVPDDLSVAGFDDGDIARMAWPALSTVVQPIGAMAVRAAETLIDRINGRSIEVEDVTMDFTLAMRASTAPPPPAG